MSLTPNQLAFARHVADLCKAECPKWGLSWEVATAQAILETGWGKAIAGHNLFGKRGKGNSGSVNITTTETVLGKTEVQHGQPFANYTSDDASVAGYCELLSRDRYSGCKAFSDRDLARYIAWVWASGYATGDTYVNAICSLMQTIDRAPGIGPVNHPHTLDKPLTEWLNKAVALKRSTKSYATKLLAMRKELLT